MLLPLGRRRTNLDRKVVSAYLAGAVAGATVTALLAWLFSGFAEPLDGAFRATLLCVGAVLAWTAKHGPLADRISLPEARRQIPFGVLASDLVRGAYRFGFEMGTGLRTYLPSFVPYVLFLAILFVRPTLLEALLVALGFGLGRAVPLMIRLGPEEQRLISRDFLQGAEHGPAQAAAGFVVLVGGLLLV